MQTAFIVNSTAGACLDGTWLAGHVEEMRGVAGGGKVTLAKEGGEIHAAVDEAIAAKCTRIVAGGGDGTLNAVASHLVGTDIALGVLPLGTLNHFAKDAGIPVDPDAALATALNGDTIAVDVGEVNGRFFLNNSSLGLYPDIVRDRKRQQSRLGRGKWLAFLWATLGALRRYPFISIRLSVDGKDLVFRTPFLFIGNNKYQMEGLDIGTRTSLDQGLLSLYVAQRTGRLGLILLGLRALFGTLKEAKDFRTLSAREIVVETRRPRIRVSTDGEVQLLETPLNYRIHAGALKVVVPGAREEKSGNPG